MAGLFSALGLGKRRSESGLEFRPMGPGDVDEVLDIIHAFDEDDAAEAQASFERDMSCKYIVEAGGAIIGMSGYTVAEGASGVAWLSWTYVREDSRRRGAAFYMMMELRRVLEKKGFRKVFIATSDYKDEDTGEDIYAPARRFYERKLNARRELMIRDYYDVGESKYIYSLPVIDVPMEGAPADRSFHAEFSDIGLADESETGFVLLWDETQDASPQKANLAKLIDRAKAKNAHAIFASLPPALSDNARTDLSVAGFSQIGKLHDYYAAGADDVYWALWFEGDD